MKINNSSIRGIFKYSDDVSFEKDDFVVDGNCIYICTADEVIGERPSLDTEHQYYSEYPGNKIVSASEYYDYVQSEDRDLQIEDKYVSAHSLCEILENMYFGFGDNGILSDHILYNPNTGIEYSIRNVREVLDYSTPNVLDTVLKTPDLNNGFIRVSRNLPEINNLLLYNATEDSDVVVLKQYTYLDSNGITPYRVQELLDPEKNRLYFRFAKGLSLESGGFDFSDSVASKWKSLYGDDADVLEMLDTVEEYWRNKVRDEYEDKINRIRGRFCYRSVDVSESNYLGTSNVYLYPGETRDIKAVEDFTSGPCVLDILIKVPIDSGISRNYSITIDAKDTVDLGQETYHLDDNIVLNTSYTISGNLQCIQLSVSAAGAVIKDIYYRDKTLDHVHKWRVFAIESEPTCTDPGVYVYECVADGCPLDPPRQKTEIVPPRGHDLEHWEAKDPTCTNPGWWEYWKCNECGVYFKDENATQPPYSGYQTGPDPVYRPPIGSSGHQWSEWYEAIPAKCTTTGLKARTCSVCGAQETEIISALGHNTNLVARLEAPDCGSFGVEEHYHCSRCNKNFRDAVGNHEMSQEDLKIYPTGNHTILHDTPQTQIIQDSTYTDDPNINAPSPEFGHGYIPCNECGNKIEVLLPLKQHEFSNFSEHESASGPATYSNGKHYPSYTSGYCTECGAVRRNYNFRDDVPIEMQLNNHTIDPSQRTDNNYTDPTCTEYGYWKGDCVLCGTPDVKQYNWDDPPRGHTIPSGSREGWEPNSCTEDAVWVGTCSVCHENHVHAVDENHRAIGHKDSDSNGRCDECNKVM